MAAKPIEDDNPFDEPEVSGPRDEALVFHNDAALGDERRIFENGKVSLKKRVFLPPEAAELAESSELGFGSDQRQSWLEKIGCDLKGGWRDLIIGRQDQIEALERLAATAGHARQLFDLILPAVGASKTLGLPLEVPPILLLSPPGLGKTYLAHEIAARLQTHALPISIANQTSTGVFTGLDPSWKAARPGDIAKVLIQSGTAQPLIILDEVDKAMRAGEYGFILGPLHDLWEPPTARRLEDDFLKLRFAADRLLWLSTANTRQAILPSILDRSIVIELPVPTPSQMRAIYQSIYDHLRLGYGDWFLPTLSGHGLSALATSPPRAARKLLSLAMVKAVANNRRSIEPQDLTYALAFLGEPTRQRMGFL